MRPHKTRSTRDRSIPRSLQRLVSMKSSISQLTFFFYFVLNTSQDAQFTINIPQDVKSPTKCLARCKNKSPINMSIRCKLSVQTPGISQKPSVSQDAKESLELKSHKMQRSLQHMYHKMQSPQQKNALQHANVSN